MQDLAFRLSQALSFLNAGIIAGAGLISGASLFIACALYFRGKLSCKIFAKRALPLYFALYLVCGIIGASNEAALCLLFFIGEYFALCAALILFKRYFFKGGLSAALPASEPELTEADCPPPQRHDSAYTAMVNQIRERLESGDRLGQLIMFITEKRECGCYTDRQREELGALLRSAIRMLSAGKEGIKKSFSEPL